MPPDRMIEPSLPVIDAALRGLRTTSADALIARLPEPRTPFQQRVVEELQRLDLTRLMWVAAANVTDIEIFRRKRWDRLRPEEARDLLLDRYRAVDRHHQVEDWIRNHLDTPDQGDT